MSEKSTSTISIESPIEEVTAALSNLSSYPQWSSSFKKVEILESDEQGRPVKAKFVVDAGALKDSPVLNFDWSQAPTTISFSLEDANMLTKMDGAYIIKTVGDQTDVTYELSVGISMPIPSAMIAKQEKSTIDLALKELKAHLEG